MLAWIAGRDENVDFNQMERNKRAADRATRSFVYGRRLVMKQDGCQIHVCERAWMSVKYMFVNVLASTDSNSRLLLITLHSYVR